MDETLRMKLDIQHCIANNIDELSTNYSMLIFEGFYKENIQCLCYYKRLDISVEDNKLLYHMLIDTEKVSELSKEEIKQVKLASEKARYIEMMEQMHESSKSETQKEMEKDTASIVLSNLLDQVEEVQKNKIYAKPKKDYYNKMEVVKSILDNIFNMSCNIEVSEYSISISINCKEIHLNEKMLYTLVLLMLFLDIFTICPYYRDNDDLDDDEIQGVRLYFGISLEEV